MAQWIKHLSHSMRTGVQIPRIHGKTAQEILPLYNTCSPETEAGNL